MKKNRIPLELYAPKHWGTWFGIFLLRLLCLFPYRLMPKISSLLGSVFFKIAKRRRRIIETNIKICFPEKTDEEQHQLALQASTATFMALFETSLTWFGPTERYIHRHTVEGMEHLTNATKGGKGVIILASHFTTLEMSGALLNSHIDNLKVVYKRSNVPLLEYFIQTRRGTKCCSGLIKHKSLREVVRSVKKGNVVSFSPDQDFGEKDSIFAPFFGTPCCTLLSTQRLAKLTGTPVIPFFVSRNEDGLGYTMRFSPALEDFPSDDDLHDATAVNKAIEEQIKIAPAQYLWAHRRFKTRPKGEADVYKI